MNPIIITPCKDTSGCCHNCRHGLVGKSWTISMGPSGGFHLCASCLVVLRHAICPAPEPVLRSDPATDDFGHDTP